MHDQASTAPNSNPSSPDVLPTCMVFLWTVRETKAGETARTHFKTLRAISNCRTDTYKDLLRRANLPSLYNRRRLQEIVISMYKVRKGLTPDCIGELFNLANKGYSLRNADFDIPRYSTVRYGKHSISYLGPYLWSWLSSSDRQRPSLDNFKRNIRKKDFRVHVRQL